MNKYDVIIVGAGPGGIFQRMSWLRMHLTAGLPYLRQDIRLRSADVRLTVIRLRNVSAVRAVQL